MIEPVCLVSIRRRATACATKNAARTFNAKMKSKSSTFTSISKAGRFPPALLTRMLNGSACATSVRTASISVTSSTRASALSPRARIASAAASISALVRAASVTCAPACASAEAAASPMPRPPPVTSARLPSRRNEGVFARSISLGRSLGRLRVGDVAAAVAAHAHVGLLGVRREAFEDTQPRAVFADLRRSLVGEHLLIGAGLEELADPQPAGVARRLPGRQRMIGADHLVTIGDVGARPQEQRPVVLHVGEEIVGVAR